MTSAPAPHAPPARGPLSLSLERWAQAIDLVWVRRHGRRLLELGLAIVLLALAIDRTIGAWPVGPNFHDYQGFVAAGRALADGINPYGPYPALPGITDQGFRIRWPEASPPAALFIFRLFSLFDLQTGARVWFVLSGLLYGALLIMLRKIANRPLSLPLWAFLLACFPVASTLSEGQIYICLGCFSAGAWLCLQQRKWVAAGILIGLLVAIKPNFAVWPLGLFVAGQATPALVALGTILGSAGGAAAAFGPAIFPNWLFGSAAGFTGPVLYNGSVFAIGPLIGRPQDTRMIGLAVGTATCLWFGVWAYRQKPDLCRLSGAAVLVALLAAPITFPGYLVIALPLLITRRWRMSTYASAGAMLLPVNSLAPLALMAVSQAFGPSVSPPERPLAFDGRDETLQ